MHDPILAGKTILVLDDAEPDLKLMGALLRKAGATPVLAADVETAKVYLTSRQNRVSPDLILSDIHMPDENGINFYIWYRISELPQVPVVMISSEASPDLIRKVGAIGVSGYILKPATAEVLYEHLGKALAEAEAEDDTEDTP